MRLNPYIAGNPIRGENFYGREDILRQVTRVLENPHENAAVLFGQRRIGKTSILLQLEYMLEQSIKYSPVYFDLQDRAGKSLHVVLFELAQRIAHKLNQPVPDQSEFEENEDYFQNEFLPQVALHAKPGGLVLLFDEFDVLDSLDIDQAGASFFPYLRQWMTKIAEVQFIFVIGRRLEDLSKNSMSTFKGVRALQVGLLRLKDAQRVIRQSEKNNSLLWEENAESRVWYWTKGHPYFTQLLCRVIWEQVHDSTLRNIFSTETPAVEGPEVDGAIISTLIEGANAFHWIWDGLPPAERVAMSAMAEVKQEVITEEDLINSFNNSGVRLILRQLELAPETLEQWGLIVPSANKSGYLFSVPLLRRWVKQNRPLQRVKEELDHLDPLAESLFQTGQQFYSMGEIAVAENQLRQAILTNPNHLKANILLAQILFEKDQFSESVQILQTTFMYDQNAVRADLVRALLAQANQTKNMEDQLAIYQQILEVDANQHVAINRVNEINHQLRRRFRQEQIQRAQEYENTGNWENALGLYEELLGSFPADDNLTKQVDFLLNKIVENHITEAEAMEKNENWRGALSVYEELLEEHPENTGIRRRIERVLSEEQLSRWYREALGSLEAGDKITAQEKLAAIIAKRPDYKDAALYLPRATHGIELVESQESRKKSHDSRIYRRSEKNQLEPDSEEENFTSPSSSGLSQFWYFLIAFILILIILFSMMLIYVFIQ